MPADRAKGAQHPAGTCSHPGHGESSESTAAPQAAETGSAPCRGGKGLRAGPGTPTVHPTSTFPLRRRPPFSSFLLLRWVKPGPAKV